MRLPTRFLLGLGLAFAVTACSEKDEDEDEGDVGSDTDTDDGTDDDTDDDTDEDDEISWEVGEALEATLVADDADAFDVLSTTVNTSEGTATVDGSTMTGVVTWEQVQTDADGTATTLCDSTVDLAGTAYSGDCEDCDFAFEVDASESDDGGITDCTPSTLHTWTETAIYKNPLMMFWSTKSEEDAYYNVVEFANLLRTGVSVDYSDYGYEYYPGPYFGTVAYDGAETGSARLTDDAGIGTLEWDFTDSYDETARTYFEYCDYIDYWAAYDNWDAAAGTSGLGRWLAGRRW